MEIKLVAYGIAKEIIGKSETTLRVDDKINLGNLRLELLKEHPGFEKLKSLKFAVNEDYQDDDFSLKERDEVVIIPPVSGG